MRFLIAIFMIMFLAPQFSHAETEQSVLAAQVGLNTSSPNAQQKYRLGSRVTTGLIHVLKAKYDFALQGGSTGAKVLVNDVGQPAVLPKNSIVVDCIINVVTPGTTSNAGTMALSTGQGVADLKVATAAASYTGLLACVPVGSAATSIKITADRTMTGTIANALTNGKWYVVVQYVMAQ